MGRRSLIQSLQLGGISRESLVARPTCHVSGWLCGLSSDLF